MNTLIGVLLKGVYILPHIIKSRNTKDIRSLSGELWVQISAKHYIITKYVKNGPYYCYFKK